MWLVIFDVPYPLLLGIFVALLDLIPYGSAVVGVIVAAVALTVSVLACIATVAFYVAFRVAEDYVLVPKIIGPAVPVPAVITLIAVLIGGALLGIVGALIAIPVAPAAHPGSVLSQARRGVIGSRQQEAAGTSVPAALG